MLLSRVEWMCLLHMWAGPNKYGHKCSKWVKSKHLRAETRHRGLPRQQAESGLSQPSSKAAQGQLLNDPNKVRKRGSCVSGNHKSGYKMGQCQDGTKQPYSDESQREDNHSRQHLTLPTAQKPTVHVRDYLSLDHPKQTANGENAHVED